MEESKAESKEAESSPIRTIDTAPSTGPPSSAPRRKPGRGLSSLTRAVSTRTLDATRAISSAASSGLEQVREARDAISEASSNALDAARDKIGGEKAEGAAQGKEGQKVATTPSQAPMRTVVAQSKILMTQAQYERMAIRAKEEQDHEAMVSKYKLRNTVLSLQQDDRCWH